MSVTDSRTSILKHGFVLAFGVVLFVAGLVAQDPNQLVDRMVQNELNAAKNDYTNWMFKDTISENGKTKAEEVIQTPQGWMRRLISVNGKAPSQDELRKSQDVIQKFLSDPAYRKQEHQKVEQDGKKAIDLLRMLPKAFLYQLKGRTGG